MIILIPAYQPDGRLVDLVRGLRTAAPDLGIVVVDDGSGPARTPVFDALAADGADVVSYPRNRGKGYALKAGFALIAERYPGHDVVCADADGQHTVDDILRMAVALCASEVDIVLGTRSFAGDVPARSRIGNTLTSWLFRLATGVRVDDTQTGLRAFRASTLPWLRGIPGDRYDYELRVLLRATRTNRAIGTVDIETVYLDGNSSSHFRPVLDSLRIYAPLIVFAMSSLLAFVVDTVLLLLLSALTGSLALSVVGARVASASVNFATNRRVVFEHGRDLPLRAAAARYVALAGSLLITSYLMLAALQALGVALLAAKIGTDVLLFLVSYTAQRRYVFQRGSAIDVPPARVGAPS